MCSPILLLLCAGLRGWQEQHLLDDRTSFFLILINILHLHHYKYQAPYVLSKQAPGSTAWVLATTLLQNITKSLLGWCFTAWYFLLGWYLSQVLLAFSYHSTLVQILPCLCLTLPPRDVSYLQTVDHTSPWKAHGLFCWQTYGTDLDEKKHVASPVLIQF